MKVLSYNVRIWTRDTEKCSPFYWRDRARRMKDMIEVEKPDVICFQEMMFPHTLFIPKGYKRVGISIHHHIYVRKGLKAKHPKFRIHWQSCDVNGIRIICVHGHWNADIADKLCKDLLDNCGSKAIAIGDYNVGIDQLTSRGLPYSARQTLHMDAVDTFQNFTKENSHGEIDHAICFGLAPTKYRVIQYIGKASDHLPIVVEV